MSNHLKVAHDPQPGPQTGASGGRASLGHPLLTSMEVAQHLSCSVEMVYKLRRLGRLPAVKLGAEYRWRPEVVRDFIGRTEGV